MKRQTNKLNLIYIFSFLGDALFSPFLALYYSSLGIEETKKGILLALIPLSSLIGSLFYGKLSKNAKKNLLIIRVLVLFQLIAMMLIGLFENYYLIMIFTLIFAIHNSTFFSFQEGICVNITSKEKRVYATTRSFGTLGYLIGSLLGGKLIDLTSFSVVFLIAGLIYVLVELLFFFIKPYEEDINENSKISFKEVFIHKDFVMYLITYILILGTWSVEEAYASIYFKSLGISASIWGYIYAFQIFIEMVVIFIINNVFKRKINHRLLLLSSFIIICARTLFLSFDSNLIFKLFFNATLRGAAWGLFLSSHMEKLKSILSEKLITKAVLILAISSNIFTTIFNYLSPYVYENISFNIYFLILFLVQITGLIIYLFHTFRRRKSINNLP